MSSEYKMNPSYTISFAKDLTLKAIENNLILSGPTAEETAKRVTDFYKTVLETINPRN